MPEESLRKRNSAPPGPVPQTSPSVDDAVKARLAKQDHPQLLQLVRLILFVTYFFVCSLVINLTQYLGAPLYWINRDLYYAWMTLTKQSYGIFVTTLQWWAPTEVRVSGDESMKNQLRQTADGRLECDFPDRLVLIANHQIYTDWIYMWWIAYTSHMHGHIYIILKESLKYIPILGQGMMFFGFIFLSRHMETDRPRMAHRLSKLKQKHTSLIDGSEGLDPMWLLIFPEGTNLSANTRRKSLAWAEKQGLKDFKNVLLPRSTGMYFCLKELDNTVDWVYDCTMAYDGVPSGEYAQDIYGLRSTFIAGLPPKAVHLYWRRFRVSSIPLNTQAEFEAWLKERWTEKDQLMDEYLKTGQFPGSPPPPKVLGNSNKPATIRTHIHAPIKLVHLWEVGNIFVVLAAAGLVLNVLFKLWHMIVPNKTQS